MPKYDTETSLDADAVSYGESDELSFRARGTPEGEFVTTGHEDIQYLRGTLFEDEIQQLVKWAYMAGAEHVTVEGTLIKGDREFNKVTISVYPFEHFRLGPYQLNIQYKTTGQISATLRVYPVTGDVSVGETTAIHSGSLESLDVEQCIEELNDGAPYVNHRVHELVEEHGLERQRARVRAFREVGMSHSDIASRLGISVGGSTSQNSTANTRISEGQSLGIACSDPPKQVLASASFDSKQGVDETVYVCRSLSTGDALVITKQEFTDEHPEESRQGTVETQTEKYDSVDNLFRSYQERDFQDVSDPWGTLLTDIDSAFFEREDIRAELREMQ